MAGYQKLTEEQIRSEIKDIKREKLNLKGYIARCRVDKDFRMNRKMRKEVYAIYVIEANRELDEKRAKSDYISLTGRALACYDAICLERDGCL